MHEIDVPEGVEVKIAESMLMLKGKSGSSSKKINTRLLKVAVEGGKITVKGSPNKKLEKVSALAAQAFSSEVRSAINGVVNGIEKRMVIFYAHFPITIEVKNKQVYIKNIFGEKVPRVTEIVGDTKVEVKGQDVIVRGADPYDVGQTVANLRKACYSRGYDTRVFQDGIYISKAE